MKKKLTSPQLLKQATDFVKNIPNAELDYAVVIDADTIRIWYRDKTTKRLSCQIQPWIKSGAVTLHQGSNNNPEFKKTQVLPTTEQKNNLLPIKYVPGDNISHFAHPYVSPLSSGYCGYPDDYPEHSKNTEKQLVLNKKKMEI